MTELATPPSSQTHTHSSRRSRAAAGWECTEPGSFSQLEPQGSRPKFSVAAVRAVGVAQRCPGVLVRRSNRQRTRGVGRHAARERRQSHFRGDRTDLGDSFSCLVAGDTGEGDHSQYAVVPGLLTTGEGTSFLVVMSDVIYPIGDGNDYVDKFFRPYGGYLAPIYALPGNHDWYDGLGGFMRHFASAEPLPPRPHGSGLKERIRDRLCAPSVIGETTLDDCRKLRPAETQQGQVPGPYWLIETEQLRFVGIDTGILGALDGDQGDWLKRISAGAKPKVLLTGKPIYVYNEHHPGKIYDRDFTVDEVVRDPTNNYIAALGGDIHNYQRYPVPVGDRTIQYIVSGGGGAFVHATHTIEKVSVAGVDEKDFRCYRCAQTRLHSTAAYTRGSSRSARAFSRSSRSRRLRWSRRAAR
jgi:hypothetical protein